MEKRWNQRWTLCEKQEWVCPHITRLDRSVVKLTESFQSLVTHITQWNQELTDDARQIMDILTKTLSINELKVAIQHSTNWILDKQAAMMDEIEKLKQNVQTLEENIEELEKDHLTGVYTRHRYTKDFWELKENFLQKDEIFSCAVIDIDNFKKINDTHTHSWWDKILKYLANVLTTKFWVDNVYRYGWEEFIILHKWKKEKLHKGLNEVLDFLHHPTSKPPLNIQLTFSGWVKECKHDDTSKSLFDGADRTMYKVKQNGKNRVICE